MAWPDDRPGTYDADKWWDELNDAWVTDTSGGGGAGNAGDFSLGGGVGAGASQWLLAVGFDDSYRKVYFGRA